MTTTSVLGQRRPLDPGTVSEEFYVGGSTELGLVGVAAHNAGVFRGVSVAQGGSIDSNEPDVSAHVSGGDINVEAVQGGRDE